MSSSNARPKSKPEEPLVDTSESTEEFTLEMSVSDIPKSCEEYISEQNQKKSVIHKAFYQAADRLSLRVVIFILVWLILITLLVLIFMAVAIYYQVADEHICYGSANLDLIQSDGELYINNFAELTFYELDGRMVADCGEVRLISDGGSYKIELIEDRDPVNTCADETGQEEIDCEVERVGTTFTPKAGELSTIYLDIHFTVKGGSVTSEVVLWEALTTTKSPCGGLIRYYTSDSSLP